MRRVYPNAIAVVQAAQKVGVTVILSDGDAVFQPRKVQKSGLWPVFGDNVLIYVHKELELADVETHFPAKRYILIDDKLRILDAVKRSWGERRDHGIPAARPLCGGPENPRGISAGRHHN